MTQSIIGTEIARAQTVSEIVFLSENLDSELHNYRLTVWTRYIRAIGKQLRQATKSSIDYVSILDALSLPDRLKARFSDPYDKYEKSQEKVEQFIETFPYGEMLSESDWEHIDEHMRRKSALCEVLAPFIAKCDINPFKVIPPKVIVSRMEAYRAMEPYVTFLFQPDRYVFPVLPSVNLDTLKPQTAQKLQQALVSRLYKPKFHVITIAPQKASPALLATLLPRAVDVETSTEGLTFLNSKRLIPNCLHLTLTLKGDISHNLTQLPMDKLKTLQIAHAERSPYTAQALLSQLKKNDQTRVTLTLQLPIPQSCKTMLQSYPQVTPILCIPK